MIDPKHLRIETMSSGNLTLVLRENADWYDFESFALKFLAAHGGKVVDRADSPVERVWNVTIGDATVWLAFDDYFARFEINAQDEAGDQVVRELERTLGLQAR
jgi:hypothetical protein